uniref:ribonuclease H n=1 Tax=Plectus sambesii TaxID=2011161 RepID=A0A914VIL3_9BILA
MRGRGYNGRRNKCKTVVIYTDGACANNGQEGARAGYGVYWGPNHPNNISEPLVGYPQTNNRAEYKAVDEALDQARALDYDRVILRTDSNLLIRSLEDYIHKWVHNGWITAKGTPVKNRQELESIYEHMDNIEVIFEHVPAHAGIRGNVEADRLARQGIQKNYDYSDSDSDSNYDYFYN